MATLSASSSQVCLHQQSCSDVIQDIRIFAMQQIHYGLAPILQSVSQHIKTILCQQGTFHESDGITPNSFACTCARAAQLAVTDVPELVAGYIGGRMVKWLEEITVSAEPSNNFYHFHDNRVLPSHVTEKMAKEEGAELLIAGAHFYLPCCLPCQCNPLVAHTLASRPY